MPTSNACGVAIRKAVNQPADAQAATSCLHRRTGTVEYESLMRLAYSVPTIKHQRICTTMYTTTSIMTQRLNDDGELASFIRAFDDA